jgi:KEOPS complex subunit Cgi121
MQGDTIMYEIRAARCCISDKTGFLQILKEIAERCNTHIICFNADMLAGRRHAESAVFHAIRSFRSGNAISNTLEMEALLYAAGSRQCSVASSFGLHDGENRLWVCCYPLRMEVWESLRTVMHIEDYDFPGEMDQKKWKILMQLFGITPEELASLDNTDLIGDLVLERVALLDVVR